MDKNKIGKYIKYTYMGAGGLLIISQLTTYGLYKPGDNIDLVLIGLLLFNIGVSFKN